MSVISALALLTVINPIVADGQARRDSTGRARPRVPATAEHLQTAFSDPQARTVLLGARAARLELDSAMISYDARGYQRVSIGLGFGAQGRDRLAYRREGATRVRWHRDIGALVEVDGARSVVPLGGRAVDDPESVAEARDEMLDSRNQLPWFPGSEGLWIGSDVVQAEVNEESLIHPLALGSEAHYTYATGDSMRLTLPDGSNILLRELRVKPRVPEWNLVVGSFWFDMATFRLVRAVYRLAVPLEVQSLQVDGSRNSATAIIAGAILSPMRGSVSSITVEYALLEGRFWLPSVRTAEGLAQISFARLPFQLQQSFRYESVNRPVEIPEIPLTVAMARRDSVILRDSLAALNDPAARAMAEALTAALAVAGDSADTDELRRRAARGDASATVELGGGGRRVTAGCDTATAGVSRVGRTQNRTVRIMVTATCNDSLLVNSPHLPPTIYDDAEEVAPSLDREELLRKLGPGLQARFAPQLPTMHFGLGDGLLRYNRVEGLSPGLALNQELGAGLSLNGTLRYGTSDKRLNGEFGVTRLSGIVSHSATGYKRLVAMNDWGNPLTFGSSVMALVFGRDEGFYYRAAGAEVVLAAPGNPNLQWRLYGERQSNAGVNTQFSVAEALGGNGFGANVHATEGDVFGAAFTLRHSMGDDPMGFRMMSLVKGENGMGDFAFGRALGETTISSTVMRRLAASLTLSAGSSIGELPAQRGFMLGGTQSVRGQRAGTSFGDAFWMARLEVAGTRVGARRALFADFGWAGSRADWSRQSRALSGVGMGWSFLDGLIRMDVARGIYPGTAWRFASYLEARF